MGRMVTEEDSWHQRGEMYGEKQRPMLIKRWLWIVISAAEEHLEPAAEPAIGTPILPTPDNSDMVSTRTLELAFRACGGFA
eukprot:SAG11_NODE_5456_length_1554_cov_2.196564_1_plen_81_part_00